MVVVIGDMVVSTDVTDVVTGVTVVRIDVMVVATGVTDVVDASSDVSSEDRVA
jgi:hypothetical protein